MGWLKCLLRTIGFLAALSLKWYVHFINLHVNYVNFINQHFKINRKFMGDNFGAVYFLVNDYILIIYYCYPEYIVVK